jgi:predicted RNA-binding Zn ribbon-like protein
LPVTPHQPPNNGASPHRPPLAVSSVQARAERQPGNRMPAPGDLRLVQSLVNSFYNLETRRENFDSPQALGAWLGERDLIEPEAQLTDRDLARVIDVRDGLRALLFINNHEPGDPAAIERLNQALHGPGLFVQLAAGRRPEFHAPRRDLDFALALIATIVAVAQLDGCWSRLKACPGDHCGWAFYDHSRNQASNWCSMSVCGQRAKARAYRRRRRD